MTHVVLQARLENKHAHTRKDVKSVLKRVGFNNRLIEANVEGLTGLIKKRLKWHVKQSEWADYTDLGHYPDQAMADKRDFVGRVCAGKQRKLVWDSGCNTGVFSRIAAGHADYVVAMDADHLAIDRFYQNLKSEPINNILPLVVNMVSTSPALGWRGLERKTLAARGKPDLLLCLALIHHIVIRANVPLEESVEWLVDLGCEVILEFVTEQDPMVKKLLLNKPDIYDDYTLDNFETNAQRHFRLDKKIKLDSGTRFLYLLHPKTG